MNNSYTRLNILLIDDSEEELFMIETAFSGLKYPHKLETALDAREALDYLNRSGKHAARKAALPDIILLDIRMPVTDGFELLNILKSDPLFKKIPVVMLTASSSKEDIARSFDGGAASYLHKPVGLEGYKNMMDNFGRYWLSVSALPH